MTTPTFDTLRIEHDTDSRVATLVLNRPGKLNALSRQLLGELARACRWLDDRSDIAVVVVRGEGRAFSAGFDLGDFADGDPTISVRDTAHLDAALRNLKRTPSVLRAQRITPHA